MFAFLALVVAFLSGVAVEQYVADFIVYHRKTFSFRHYAWYTVTKWPVDFYQVVLKGGR